MQPLIEFIASKYRYQQHYCPLRGKARIFKCTLCRLRAHNYLSSLYC